MRPAWGGAQWKAESVSLTKPAAFRPAVHRAALACSNAPAGRSPGGGRGDGGAVDAVAGQGLGHEAAAFHVFDEVG